MTFLLSGDLEVFELVRQNGDADLFARVNGLGRYIYIYIYYGRVPWKGSTYEDLSTEC